MGQYGERASMLCWVTRRPRSRRLLIRRRCCYCCRQLFLWASFVVRVRVGRNSRVRLLSTADGEGLIVVEAGRRSQEERRRYGRLVLCTYVRSCTPADRHAKTSLRVEESRRTCARSALVRWEEPPEPVAPF
jgi:hypothetical protein